MEAWIAQYGQIVYFFAQIAFWFFMVVFVGYAVAQYKRWVNYQLGTGPSGRLRADVEDAKDAEETVSVEEFVE